MALRGLMDRLEGHWLGALADLDARGAAGAEHGVQAGSTASWLRARLHMSASTAASLVRTARALHRGPLTGTAQALADGELSPAHAQVLAPAPRISPTTSPPTPNQCCWRPPGGWTRRGCGGSSPICGWSPTPTAPTPGRTAASAAGGVAGGDLGGHGRRQRAAGPRGRPDGAGRPGAPGPPQPAPTTPAARPSVGLMPWSSWPAAPWRPAGCPRAVGSDPSCW